jgi:hypothetical protein
MGDHDSYSDSFERPRAPKLLLVHAALGAIVRDDSNGLLFTRRVLEPGGLRESLT